MILIKNNYHPEAKTSAICKVFIGKFFDFINPSRCIKQLRSVEIIIAAFVAKTLLIF